MPKVPKRAGLVAMLAVLAAVVGTATIAAVAGSEPEKLECSGEWGSIGFVEASQSYKTPQEAAAAFMNNGNEDVGQLPSNVELVELSGSGSTRFAARVDGKTQKILKLAESGGEWTVEGFDSC